MRATHRFVGVGVALDESHPEKREQRQPDDHERRQSVTVEVWHGGMHTHSTGRSNCNSTTTCYGARLGSARDTRLQLPPAYVQCTCALEHRGYSRGYEQRAWAKKPLVIQTVSASYSTPAGGARPLGSFPVTSLTIYTGINYHP